MTMVCVAGFCIMIALVLNFAAVSFELHDVMAIATPSCVQCDQFHEARVLCTALQPVCVVTRDGCYHLLCSHLWHGRLTVHNILVLLPASLQTAAVS